MKNNRTGKIIVLVGFLFVVLAVLFAANRKNDGHTGLFLYVTDPDGNIATDAEGDPMTEEWITSVEYATDENGKTYTNANGEKVTVKQTRPTLTKVLQVTGYLRDESGQPLTDENGSFVTGALTRTQARTVTDADGQAVTQTVTQKDGEAVTEENGEPVTEPVTEIYTEAVTKVIDVGYESTKVSYSNREKKTTTNLDQYTTAKPPKTKADDATSSSKKIVASCDWLIGAGGSSHDRYVKVKPVSSKSFVALAKTASSDGDFNMSKTDTYCVLVKYNDSGKIQWNCSLAAKTKTDIYDFDVLKDGSFICAGYVLDSNGRDFRCYLVKVSAGGAVQWTKDFQANATNYFTAVTATPDGGFVVGGRIRSTDSVFSDMNIQASDGALLKCDADGDIKWKTKIGGSSHDEISALDADNSGNIYVAAHGQSTDGDFKGNHGAYDVVIVKLSAGGEKLWVKLLGGSKSEEINDICANSVGCLFAGYYASSDGSFTLNRGSSDAFFGFCGAENGTLSFLNTYGGFQSDRFNAVTTTSFGYALVGITSSDNRDFAAMGNKGGTDGFIVSIDTKGNMPHTKGLGSSEDDSCNDICLLNNNTFIIVGETRKTDLDFASVKPAADKDNGTAIVGRYQIY